METTKVEPKPAKERAEVFLKEYQALCEKHRFRIVVSPAFAGTNHGTFEVVLQTSVGELPKGE